MRETLVARRVKSIKNQTGIRDGFFHGHRTRERNPFDQFHHDIVRTHIVNLADIRMIECRDGPRFPFKPCGKRCLRNLHRHIAVQLGVARLPYFTHPAFADRRKDLVAAEFVAGLNVHVGPVRASIKYKTVRWLAG